MLSPDILTLADLEHHAHDRMDKQTRDYYNEGADANSTLRSNASAYTKYRLRPRVLRDVSRLDLSTIVFGAHVALPIGIAPTAMQCLAHPDGELATAAAARAHNVAMGVSSFATQRVEDVAAAAGHGTTVPLALQLYLFENRAESAALLHRARMSGFKAICLTVDTPYLGRRHADTRNQFKLPPHLRIANFPREQDREQGPPTQGSTSPVSEGGARTPPSGPVTFHSHAPNPTLTWATALPWIREQLGPEQELWIKGVLTGEDAALAVQHGADGVIVSNHGGRQLDGAVATLDAVEEVVAATRGTGVRVHVDGGVRHGTDVFKALALGAEFVWVGRPVLWGLACGGQEGVEGMLGMLGEEFRLCMGLAGTTSVKDIDKKYLVKMDKDGFVSKL